jgi:hypothetical protein
MSFSNHFKLVFGGIFTSGDANAGEGWEFTLNGIGEGFTPAGPGGPQPFDPPIWLAESAPDLTAWFGDAANWNSSHAALTYLKCNEIGPDGKYVTPLTTYRLDFAAVAGGRGPGYPGFLSTCYSWGTARTRGPGSKGRVYPPNAYLLASASSDFLAAGAATTAVGAAQRLLTAVSTARLAAGTFHPVVASAIDASLNPITHVRVGNRLDVQRRRKNKGDEIYVGGVWP